MPPEANEQERREIIRQLEQEQRRLSAEAEHLNAQIAQVTQRQLSIMAALLRAWEPPLSNDVCLSCWIIHGEQNKMKAIPGRPVAKRHRFVCPRCEREELREPWRWRRLA